MDGEGHSNIESSEAAHEMITVSMESPKVKVWGVSSDRVTYNVYIEESSGIIDIPTHGIIGQYYSGYYFCGRLFPSFMLFYEYSENCMAVGILEEYFLFCCRSISEAWCWY